MTKLLWDTVGDRVYETGVDRGVLYVQASDGTYPEGVPWNGLTTVTEKPTGAAATAQYADNIKYLNLISVEQFTASIDAFTYPDEFGICDGTATPEAGVAVHQQHRKSFGLCYRTLVGNDVEGTDHGYKLHLVWGATAAPTQKAYATVNDSPQAIAFAWELTTIATVLTTVDASTGRAFKPTALITIDSTEVDATALANLETLLYGASGGSDARLPSPDEVLALFSGTVTVVTPTAPTYVNGTHTLTIPSQVGVEYLSDGVVWTAGAHVITRDQVVNALPTAGHVFGPPDGYVDEWFIDFS